MNHLGSEPVALETGRVFDQPRAEAAVRELLIAIGENPDRPGLRDTPARVARSYREVFAGLYTDPDTVLNTTFDEGHQELVLVRDIPLYSTCEHHLVSFHGVAHVGYIPGKTGKVTGLSKLARVVDLYAKRPQVQERLTSQIADASCASSTRGVRSWSSRRSTCAWRCGGSASLVRVPPPPRCVVCSSPARPHVPRLWTLFCGSDRDRVARARPNRGDGRPERHHRFLFRRRAFPRS